MVCKICKQKVSNNFGNAIRNHFGPIHNMDSKAYYDSFIKKKDEGLCKYCKKQTSFISINKGYSTFCSRKCTVTFHNKNIGPWTVKRKNTCIKNYGTDNPMKNTSIQQKAQQTLEKKIGVKHPYKKKEIIESVVEKKQLIAIKKLSVLLPKNITIKKYLSSNEIILQCSKCKKDFSIQFQYIRLRLKRKENLCIYCNPIKYGNFSYKEKELLSFIESNYSGNIIHNTKDIISPYELDIYLPDLKLAFEFNGLYWHSEFHKSKNYHLDKTEECEKLGIHLIHIYEDDWTYKQEIVQSRILNLLGKSKRIYARNTTTICDVDSKIAKEFLEENHIQGNCNSHIRIGLFKDDKLLSLMTFGKGRFHNKDYELLRFCNKCGYTVVGGAAKLFKEFIKRNYDKPVISYADRSWSQGNLYEQLGFKKISKTCPNYQYVIDGIRYNRFKFRKSELVLKGFDSNKTEHEIMIDRNIPRIYDCGSLKYKCSYYIHNS